MWIICLAALQGPACAQLQATVMIRADDVLHPVSPLSCGTNIVLSGTSNEKMAGLVDPFQRMGITNLRLHLNTGVEYLWESHAPKPGTKFGEWGIFDPLRDNDPFERVKALRKVVDAGNSVTSDHYRRTDLRCSGVISKTAAARNAYGEVRLSKPTDVVYARCDVWIERPDAVTSPEDSPWTLMALRDADGQTIICAQIGPNLGIRSRTLPDRDGSPTSDPSPPLSPGRWHSVEIAARLGAEAWVSFSYDGKVVKRHDNVSIPGGPIVSACFGCVDNGASGRLWMDGCRVDDEPFEGDLGNGLQHLGRVTFDRAPINTDDFLYWCNLGGFEPVFQLPVANIPDSQYDDDTLIKWFEYCNGGPATEGGKLRAQRGRERPYAVTYWELGNEPYYGDNYRDHSAEYADRIVRLAQRMKAIDPNIKIIANTNYHDDLAFPHIADAIDLWGLRHFYQPPPRDRPEEVAIPWMLGSGAAVNRRAGPGGPDIISWWYHGNREELGKLAPGHGDIPLAQTEYDLWLRRNDEKQSSLLCGIYKASVLGQHIKNDIKIIQTFYHPLPDTTTARVFELFTGHLGEEYLGATIASPTYDFDNSYGGSPDYNTWTMPYVSAFPSRTGNSLYLVLVNRHQTEDIRCEVTLEGAEVAEASGATIESDDLWATDLSARELPIENTGGKLVLTLPNQSVSGVRCSLGRQTGIRDFGSCARL